MMNRTTTIFRWMLLTVIALPMLGIGSCINDIEGYFRDDKDEDAGDIVKDVFDDVEDLIDHIF